MKQDLEIYILTPTGPGLSQLLVSEGLFLSAMRSWDMFLPSRTGLAWRFDLVAIDLGASATW